MKKGKVIGFNESGASSAMHELKRHIQFLNEIIQDYQSFDLDEIQSIDELIMLIDEPKKLLVSKLSKGVEPSINGIKLNYEKAFEVIEKPTDMESFPSKIESSKAQRNMNIDYRFVTIKNGYVVFNEAQRKLFELQFEIRLDGNRLEAYETLNAALENLNKLIKKHRLSPGDCLRCIRPESGLPKLGDPLIVDHKKVVQLGNL